MVHENYERLVYFDGVSSTLSLSPIRLPCCLKAPSSFTLSRPARKLCCLFRTHIQVAHAEGSKRYSFVGYTYVNHLNLFLYSNTAPLSLSISERTTDTYIIPTFPQGLCVTVLFGLTISQYFQIMS